MKIYLLLLFCFNTLKMFHCSDCDINFVFSGHFNTNGFKISCENIIKGEEKIIKSVAAYSAFLLDITNSTLDNITSDLFENIPKIKELNIKNSKLSFSHNEKTFFKFEVLQRLSIENTTMENFTPSILNTIDQLLYLYLENNHLSKLPKGSLRLNNLEDLHFVKNNLQHIEDLPLCELPNLKHLDLKYNKLTDLNGQLYKCIPKKKKDLFLNITDSSYSLLESVDLSYNYIKNINNAFDKFISLKNINIKNNILTEINSFAFKNVKYLEKLNLANNKISKINKDFLINCNYIKSLNINNNFIFNVSLKKFNYLTDLKLANNLFTFNSLHEINNLPNLKTYVLAKNALKGKSNKYFNQFSKLTTLDISQNNVELEDTTFNNLTELESLNLARNSIKLLPKLIFSELVNLKFLDLSENSLEKIDNVTIFNTLGELQMLNLSYNELRAIDYELFVELNNLNILDITGNKLSTFNYQLIISKIPSLDFLMIKNNLFSCELLKDIIAYFDEKGVNFNKNDSKMYEEENIDGIPCKENVQYNLLIQSEKVYINTGIFLIFFGATLVVIILMSFKYYQYYRRRNYQCEQFELINE